MKRKDPAGIAPEVPVAQGALPLLGHLVPLARDPLGFLRDLATREGLLRVRLGPISAVVVCDPGLTREVLRRDRVFDKGGFYFKRAREMAGDGLATCPYSKHRRQRRLVQPAFHIARLPGYAQIMADQIDTVTRSWEDGQVLDALANTLTIASRTIVATLFSNTLPPSLLKQALDALTTGFDGVYKRLLLPPPLDRLPTPGNLSYHRANMRLRSIIDELIGERRAGNTDHGDLLSALLAACGPEDDGDDALSDSEIRDQVVTFFLAGTETTANTLAWALHLITQHPDVYDRLRAEVDQVLAGRSATYADLPRLDLTSRVISETLRLWPPTWMFTRTVTEDTQLGEYRLSAGTTVVYSPYLLHHRPDLYSDPCRFDPDRWTPDQRSSLPRDAFIPFGNGARKCIGETFARTETTLALATLTAQWHLHIVPGRMVQPAPSATLRPKDLHLRATRRPSLSI